MRAENTSFAEIWQALRSAHRIALSLHPSPDGDSLGCCTALKYVLERDCGSRVTLISPDALSENLAALPFTNEIQFGADISDLRPEEHDLFVCMDYGSLRAFSVKKRGTFSLPAGMSVINIDHHVVNDYHGTLNYVDSSQPSLCSLLIDFFAAVGVSFDAELARRLLIGVCTDSGFFTYDSNPYKALKDAVFLIEHGADYLDGVLRPVLYNQPLKLKKYQGALINALKFSEEFKCGYACIAGEEIKTLGLNEAEVRIGINELQFISEFDFVFTLAEMGDHIKGSFRTKKSIDVSLFAKALGGGGHTAAAAFVLPQMPLLEAEQLVFAAIRSVKGRDLV
ncbi:MAG TPA: DHH family phosphoesterase [Candidatus Nanoarchaeia archaeon]|nr:DHH family phosphoesterase [Candidatus Nanoarchaeia archaeon]